jgi:hypothetical protein
MRTGGGQVRLRCATIAEASDTVAVDDGIGPWCPFCGADDDHDRTRL